MIVHSVQQPKGAHTEHQNESKQLKNNNQKTVPSEVPRLMMMMTMMMHNHEPHDLYSLANIIRVTK
jgi:hypothetical protein